jgi:hypothetical protein
MYDDCLLFGGHLLPQRHEPGTATEVVGEVAQPEGAVVDRLLAGLGDVHRAEHPPAATIGLLVARLGRHVRHDVPRLADGGEPALDLQRQ